MNLNLNKEPYFWNPIALPQFYAFPPELKPALKKGVYAIDFPAAPFKWYADKESGTYRSTSAFWVSEKINYICGIQFRGRIQRNHLGPDINEFAVFYHEKLHYDGGPEYGWVFREGSNQGVFYTLTEANLPNQKWLQWPADKKDPDQLKTVDDPQAIQESTSKLSELKYWNIKILKSGDFQLETVIPDTWEYRKCTIKKPEDFPNLFGKEGYITICAQKRADDMKPPSSIFIDEVKIWQ